MGNEQATRRRECVATVVAMVDGSFKENGTTCPAHNDGVRAD